MAAQLGIAFYETSAQQNLNINEAFQTIAKDIKDNILVNDNYVPNSTGGTTIRVQ